jgi:acyl dehydratase
MGRVLALAAVSPLLKRDRKVELPSVTMGVDGVRTDKSKLAAYNRVCGFRDSDVVPATWIHILAFPLAGALLTDERFPFPMIGLVHIANRITQHRGVRADEAVDIRARLGNLKAHDKGVLFSVLTEVNVRGTKVWEEESVYLRRGKFKGLNAPKAESPAEDTPVEQPESTATWELPEDLGRRYGQASGDMNPIHLHALSARAFGFKRAIAHGMWTQAHALAELSSKLSGDAFTLDTHFKLPAFLPSTTRFRTQTQGKATLFELRDKSESKPHARGRISLL